MSFWIESDPCHLSTTSLIDLFIDTFFLVIKELICTPLSFVVQNVGNV
jgi:hypothetical protein